MHVVDTGIGELDRERLSQMCVRGGALAWHDPSSFGLDPLPLMSRMTTATYSRLALSRLLPADVEKVVWLDADVLVTGDLERLWEAHRRRRERPRARPDPPHKRTSTVTSAAPSRIAEAFDGPGWSRTTARRFEVCRSIH